MKRTRMYNKLMYLIGKNRKERRIKTMTIIFYYSNLKFESNSFVIAFLI